MTATITATNGAGTTSPLSVLSPYSAEWASRNIVHDLIGGGIAVSLIAPRPRNGVLELLYAAEADAVHAVTLHREETTFLLTEDDAPSVGMTYVLDGSLGYRLDEGTLILWIVTLGYQEVTP